MIRTITLSPADDADKWVALHQQCGGDKPIREAIGYLSTWAMQTYPVVNISLMGEPGDMELYAVYRKEPAGPIGYVIGAVWRRDIDGGHFGFHS